MGTGSIQYDRIHHFYFLTLLNHSSATQQIVLQYQNCTSLCTDEGNHVHTGSLKPNITVSQQKDGTVPQAIIKYIPFLLESRNMSTKYIQR